METQAVFAICATDLPEETTKELLVVTGLAVPWLVARGGAGSLTASRRRIERLDMLAPDRNAEHATEAEIVDEAIMSRRSVRAFLPTPVAEETIRDILQVAARAPSGTNMQPWKVYVVTGDRKRELSAAILSSGIRAEKASWDESRARDGRS